MTLRNDLKAAFDADPTFTWCEPGDLALGSLPIVFARYGGSGPDARPVTELVLLTGSNLSKNPYETDGVGIEARVEAVKAIVRDVPDAYPDELPVLPVHAWPGATGSPNTYVGALVRVVGA